MGRHRTENGAPKLVTRPESPYYHIAWYDPVRRKVRRKSTGTSSLAEAEEQLRVFLHGDGAEDKSAQPEADGDHTVVSVVQAFYDQYAWKQSQAPAVRAAIKHFSRFFDETRICDLPRPGDQRGDTMEDVVEAYAEWRASDGVSIFTINRELATLRTACNALRRGQPDVIVPEVPYLEEPEIEPNWITQEEFQNLVAAATYRHTRTFIELLIATAARPGAIFEMRWSQIDFRSRRINLNPVGRVQTSKGRPRIQMTDRIYTYLSALRAEEPTSTHVLEMDGKPVVSNLKRSFRSAVKDAGLDPKVVTPKTLRHTAASWMVQDGMSLKKVAEFLGHGSTRMVEKHYGHLHPDYQREAVAVLENRLQDAPGVPSVPEARHKNGVARQKRATDSEVSSRNSDKSAKNLVEPTGLEPVTSTMPL